MAFDWTDERRALAKKLWAEGYSANAIASRIGAVSRSAVIGMLYRSGVPPRSGHKTTHRIRGQMPPRRKKMRNAPWGAKHNPELEASRVKAALAEYEAIRSRPDLDVPPHERKTILIKDKRGRLCANDALDQHSCRWSLTDTSPFEFCGRTVVLGTSWCEFHLRRVASPPALAARLSAAETTAHRARVKEAA